MLTYDDKNLRKLFADLEPKRRRQAFKKSFRKTANKVKRVAARNVKATGLHHSTELSKGVRAVVYKRDAGFRVTVATRKANKKGKGESGMHTNRRGVKKPILIWAEDGTKRRYTKTKTKVYTRRRKGHYTGAMKRYGFMVKTMRQVKPTVTEDLRKELTESVKTIANKYGCK